MTTAIKSDMTEQDDGPKVWFTWNLVSAGNTSRMRLYPRDVKDRPQAGASRNGKRFTVTDRELALADGTTLEGDKFARACPDFQVTQESVPVLTERFRDLLMQFDMGANHLVECRFMDWERKVDRPERFWIMSVAEWKEGVDLEATPVGPRVEYTPDGIIKLPNVLERSQYGERYEYNVAMDKRDGGGFALKSHVAEGVDLWRDPLLIGDVLFLSDRLKRAIEAAKFKFRSRPNFSPNILT